LCRESADLGRSAVHAVINEDMQMSNERFRLLFDNTGYPVGPRVQVGVYGTLKEGFHRHDSLGIDKKYLGIASVPGILLHMDEHPMLVRQKHGYELRQGNTVAVQVYDIDASRIKILDHIEGHPYYYAREVIFSTLFGDILVYYGDYESQLLGIQKVIMDNVWNGPSTPSLEVDFKNGISNPHIKMKAVSTPNGLINTETGEIVAKLNAPPIITPTPNLPVKIEPAKAETIIIPDGKEHSSPFSNKIVNL
jgi:gamma-glutamylcyclotransferase (GGCT)/AIG2-like uncharacterized protein YtfP